MKNSGKIALCGVVTALSFMCMLLTGIITVGTYALPALAGLFLIIPSVEISIKWSFYVYFAVSLLSIFIAVDKEAAIIFVLLFGYYPILKLKIDMFKIKVVQYILKIFISSLSMILSFIIAIKVLGIPVKSFEIFGINTPWILLIFGNIVFLMYDYAINDIFKLYNNKFRKKIRKVFH